MREVQELQVRSLCGRDPLEEKMATCSSVPLGGHQADVCPQLPGERKTGSLQTEKLDRVKFLVPEAHTRKSGLSATGRDRPSGHSGTSGVVGPVGS